MVWHTSTVLISASPNSRCLGFQILVGASQYSLYTILLALFNADPGLATKVFLNSGGANEWARGGDGPI